MPCVVCLRIRLPFIWGAIACPFTCLDVLAFPSLSFFLVPRVCRSGLFRRGSTPHCTQRAATLGVKSGFVWVFRPLFCTHWTSGAIVWDLTPSPVCFHANLFLERQELADGEVRKSLFPGSPPPPANKKPPSVPPDRQALPMCGRGAHSHPCSSPRLLTHYFRDGILPLCPHLFTTSLCIKICIASFKGGHSVRATSPLTPLLLSPFGADYPFQVRLFL